MEVSDPLRLRITYRVFRKGENYSFVSKGLFKLTVLLSEVEALIENSVNQVLAILPTVVPHRKIIVDSLVKALERDAKWVELYGITGQLDAPTTQDLDGELGDALQKIKEVRNTRNVRNKYKIIQIPAVAFEKRFKAM